MASAATDRLLAVTAAAATAALLYFGSGLTTLPALAWSAPLPVILVAPRLGRGLAASTALAGWLLGLANLIPYLLDDLRLPPAALLFLPGLAIVFTATVLLYRALVRRRRYLLAALGAPAAWAALDYAIAMVSPHGAFTSLAYTQADVAPINQLVSLTGPWGLSFLLFLPAAVIATLTAPGLPRRRGIQLLTGLTLVAAGILSYGLIRLSADEPPQAVKIAIVSAKGEDDANWSSPGGPAVLTRYRPLIENAAAAGARIVLLPEKIIDIRAAQLPELTATFQELALSNQIHLVVGLTVLDEQSHDYNRAITFSPSGAPPATYDKHHLIPGIEPYTAGDQLGLIPGTTWGMLICKDLDFPALARQYGQKNVGLLLVPALDFESDGWLHSRMAILRGIENGIPLARNGSKGQLTLTDAEGRIVAEATAPADRSATLLADLHPGIHSTLYTRWGDWFAWLCALIAGTALLGAVRGSGRGARQHASIRHDQLR